MKKFIAILAFSALSVPAFAAGVPEEFLGQSSSVDQATDTVVIGPKTSGVHFDEGKTYRIVLPGGRDFAWTFNGPPEAFELDRIAPAGTLDHRVVAYVDYAWGDPILSQNGGGD